MNAATQAVGYQQARGQLVAYIERAVRRKNYLIQQQDQEPTSDRNRSLNLLESDIATLIAYLLAVDTKLQEQQAQIDRLANTNHRLSLLLDCETERAALNSANHLHLHTLLTRPK
ncbi:hypothetical protein [Fibrella aquatilis]|uniref:Uncharacterized protein n=1 Tax=Fibrella aquatilis TaxID=2817059 RepID=A0A939GB61_9BACT|nr:hypothetical protein [Fibrella aquatilis]MBO0934588.1 hypothetical protein [Fibrella aquatilis]